MKRLIFLSAVLLLAAFLVTACDDDIDCPVCPEEGEIASVHGEVFYRAGSALYANGEVFATNSFDFQLDSVLLEGEPCALTVYGYFGHWYATYACGCTTSANLHQSDDTVILEFFSPRGLGACTTEVLDRSTDRVEGIDWDPVNYAHPDSSFTIEWHSVTNADWYSVDYSHIYYDADSHYRPWGSMCATTDTLLLIPPAHVDSAGCSFWITPGTGPSRNDSIGNVKGGVFRGKVNSYGGTAEMVTFLRPEAPARMTRLSNDSTDIEEGL